MTAHRRTHIVATGHSSPFGRVRAALEAALSDLSVDRSTQAEEIYGRNGLTNRVERLEDEIDRLLDALAGSVVAQAKPLVAEAQSIHEDARRLEAERVQRLPRTDGLTYGRVAAAA